VRANSLKPGEKLKPKELSHKAKIFFNNIISNPINRSERFRRSMACWNLTIKLFILLYYNHMRR